MTQQRFEVNSTVQSETASWRRIHQQAEPEGASALPERRTGRRPARADRSCRITAHRKRRLQSFAAQPRLSNVQQIAHDGTAVHLLLQTMPQTIRMERRFTVGMLACMAVIFAYSALGLVFLNISLPNEIRRLIFWRLQLPVTLGMLPLLFGTISRREARKRGVGRLIECQDIRTAGLLIDAMFLLDSQARPQIQEALIALLPRMQATDRNLLSTEQRRKLRRMLSVRNVPLSIAILKALEQIGDSRDLEAVQKLADNPGTSSGAVALRAAALECLPFLQANIRRETDTLLRASDAVSATSDILLRPAQSRTPTSTNELLRVPENGDV